MRTRKTFSGLTAAATLCGLSLAGGSPAAAAVPPPLPIIYEQVINYHSGKCLEVAGGSQANGARVQQYSCNGTVAQQWNKRPTSGGYFQLVVASSGKCVEIASASQANGYKAQQNPCGSGYHQQFTHLPSGVSGYPFIVARHSGKGLTIASESLLNGAQIVQYDVGDDGPDTLHAGDWQFR
ncbi:RICIN domain-containing protein [Streptomyces sp. V1I1]|uniref:RICIN domain-containing protein n=1 Tax=Streptomyces sp. V1I1 TaxID=3042272 RepID=UPI0027D8F1E1|nr:RICIN domain-containing protein [Streptomyces sp. V1I1]